MSYFMDRFGLWIDFNIEKKMKKYWALIKMSECQLSSGV